VFRLVPALSVQKQLQAANPGTVARVSHGGQRLIRFAQSGQNRGVMEPADIVEAYKRKDVPTLIGALGDSGREGNPMAARYLGKLRAAEAVPALQACLDDEFHGTRSLAMIALGQIGDERAIQALIVALRQNNLEERGSAAMKLGKLQATEAVPALLECLDVDDHNLQMSALWALGKIGDERAIPRVAELAETTSLLGVSTRATDVLAELGDPRAIPQFVSLLTEIDRHFAESEPDSYFAPEQPFKGWWGRPRKVKWWIQKWAARRLVELRATEAAPAVEEAANSASSFRERLLMRRTARRLRQS
jgi:HEAT repeat protein